MEDLPAWHDDRVVAVAVGVGPTRAGAGAAQVLDVVAARRVVITGVAGALDASLKVGDLVRPVAVVDVRSGVVRTPSATALGEGVLATVERVHLCGTGSIGDVQDRRLPLDATAVDMESAAIAAVCEANGVPWDVVRAVSDVAGTLTSEIASLLRPDGRADVARAARLALRDPRALARLVRLGLDTARAVRVATSVVVSELAATDLGRRRGGRREGTNDES
jgi:adenosylhomocysteine nucleosidase